MLFGVFLNGESLKSGPTLAFYNFDELKKSIKLCNMQELFSERKVHKQHYEHAKSPESPPH